MNSGTRLEEFDYCGHWNKFQMSSATVLHLYIPDQTLLILG